MKNVIIRILLPALFFGAMVTASWAATNQALPLYFLKLAQIPGDSTVAGHEGEAEINAFTFDIKNAVSDTGGGSSVGRPIFADLAITKRQDAVTPALFLKIVSGGHIAEATITARYADGKMEDYLIIKLSQVFVTSMSETSAGQDGVFENLTLKYGAIKISSRKRDAKGNLSPWMEVSWNLETNKS